MRVDAVQVTQVSINTYENLGRLGGQQVLIFEKNFKLKNTFFSSHGICKKNSRLLLRQVCPLGNVCSKKNLYFDHL